MDWRFASGDIDILRDAVSASGVFAHRVRKGWLWCIAAAAGAAVLLLVVWLMLAGPGRTGMLWATAENLAPVAAVAGVGWLVFAGWVIFKFLPGRNDRVVISLRTWVRSLIDPLDEQVRALSDDQLREKTAEFRKRLAAGESLDKIRPEAYACVREASRRARNHRQFECQLIGAKVLEDCNVAEMRTGEGKTIVCYCANYMKVLAGLKVHMVTVNDYLVKRDAEFCRPIFELLGVSVGFITADMETFGPGAEVRRRAYGCDITYGTNSEFGFDYLRDNMKHHVRDQVQGRQDYVVVDEVDSILIDEARTPLIISGPAHDDVDNYRRADIVSRMLLKKQEAANADMKRRIDTVEATATKEMRDNLKFRPALEKFRADPFWLSSDEAEAIGHLQFFVVEEDRKSVHMTEHGAKAAQAELGLGTFYDSKNMNWPHYIDNALRAHLVYHKDKEYVVQDGIVIIVDEFTGRLMHGRQWSDGLHQAVEAKERVTIKQESQTLATITLQNLFKLYQQLAGMTGTAMTEADEFMKIYKLEVIAIPTNKPIRRVDYNDKLYKSHASKLDAIVEEIRSYSQKGYPADPWSIYDMLKQARRRMREERGKREAGANLEAELAMIDEALAAFKDGAGDPAPMEQAYLKLVGDNVGGRPLLVGTVSVESSEKLSDLLTHRYGIDHEVLNAKNHAREAEIVAKAGQQHEVVRARKKEMHGNVTIATNMAGRGTDIVLGPGVAAIGGLHVVGTERHESRRIDNQLRGRCGRQGDPGSSRFFLSLEDDLLRLFMGEWVLRMLGRYALEEGVPIESRQLTKGIERAQKKVEERNFGIRKNLLEYDEVMDFQRKSFYEMRQRVVEGRELSQLIWDMIDEAVNDAVTRYYDPQYPANCVAEWCSQQLGVAVDARKLDTGALEVLSSQVRDLTGYELQSSIQRTIGEYIDPDVPAEEWDVRGLAAWAANFGLSLTQNQVRSTDPDELQEMITQAALRKIEAADLAPLKQYVDPLFARSRLARWAQEKFGVTIPIDEIATAGADDAERIIREKMRRAYEQREVEYPVAAVIEFALQRGGTNVNEVYTRIAGWVNRKYRLGWTYEHLEGKDPQQIFRELRAINEDYLRNGKMDKEIDAALREHPGEAIVGWARERFGTVLDLHPIAAGDNARESLRRCAYEMLRYELTQLERMVLLTTFDAVWKDHMYAMDLLRHGIGLRGYAERDPKIEYKREGTRLFSEMMANIRERVTDLIFRVQVSVAGGDFADSGAAAVPAPTGPTGASGLGGITTTHADATGAGFATAAQDQAAAMRQQGEGGKPQTIRRAQPKVGRNDPCPCGSGKKYKQCHGRKA
jgi:preprotein translocase subunit SecA